MSAFDDRMRALSERLLSRFGGQASLSTSTSSYDFVSGTVTGSETVRAGRAVLTSKTLMSDDGRLYTKTIATLQEEPAIGSKLTIGQMVFTVASVETVAPSGDVPIVYRATLTDGGLSTAPAPVTPASSGMSVSMMLAAGAL